MSKFEVKGRKVMQEYKLDQAIKRVEGRFEGLRGQFSERLSTEINQSSKVRRELAKDTDCALRTLTTWEQYTPRGFKRLASLCRSLDLDANYLLGLTEERKTLTELSETAKLSELPKDYCEHCGTTEFLCGEGGHEGCSSARARQ